MAIDMVWLGLIAKGFYAKQVGFLTRPDVNWASAFVFYFLFTLGLVIFVISPSIEKGSFLNVILLGSLFGLIAYATFDLTNLAIVKDWPLLVTIVDLIWGSFIACSVSSLTYLIATKLNFK